MVDNLHLCVFKQDLQDVQDLGDSTISSITKDKLTIFSGAQVSIVIDFNIFNIFDKKKCYSQAAK